MTEASRSQGHSSERLSLAMLQAENQRLRSQLDAMLREARLNQEKMRRFDLLERQVIGAASLAALIDTLLVEYKSLFELDAVTLALVDPLYEVGRVLGDPGHMAEGLLFLDSDVELQSLYTGTGRPLLAGLDEVPAFLFEDAPAGLASVALLPLLHHGRFIGSLNLGSRDAQRFVAGSSTDFLERLAALVAVCLDSALATERLKLAGLTDVLTGVHNRRYFESRCLEEVLAARRSGQPLVCMFLDVDHFKRLNDTHGHPFGDEVLKRLASILAHRIQRTGSLVARYGGEEFAVLLPDTDLPSAAKLAEFIRQQVENMSLGNENTGLVRITISIGVACASDTALTASTTALVDMADRALYQAKRSGRNQVAAATP